MLTGFLEEGESPEAAVVREIREELGVQTERVEFVGHFPLPKLNQLIIAYVLRTTRVLALNHEIAEVKMVSSDELASFDFGPLQLTRDIVSRWPTRAPHVMEAVDELTYLVGGQIDTTDVVTYPDAGLRRVGRQLQPLSP